MEKKTPSLNAGHRERLRNAFFKDRNALADYVLLEMLLTYAIPRRDVKALAKTLLLRFETLSGVLNAEKEALCEVSGVGDNAAALIQLVRELNSRYLLESCREKDLLNQPDLVADFARMKIGGEPRETLLVIYLDARMHILDFEAIPGSVNRATAYCDELAKSCLRHNAVSVILAHNHPSGFCEPSENDIRLTQEVSAALRTVKKELLDHLIVSPHTYYSFKKSRRL